MKKTVLKILSFIMLLMCMTACLNRLLRPVFYFDEWAAPSSTYSAFYNLERDSIDVLFLGNSHSYTAFSPQIIYNRNGITSYNLASGNQSTFISYYWLKEALTKQSPKAVVLEVSPCIGFNKEDGPLAMTETYLRRNLDYMRLSKNKLQAAKDICSYDPSQSVLSYIIPLFRYHTRWKEINEEDYLSPRVYKDDGLFGYSMDIVGSCNRDIENYSADSSDAEEAAFELEPVMEKYLDQITDLCKQENITLILVSTPYSEMNLSKHAAVASYCNANNLTYIDYNEKKYYTESQYSFADDNGDGGHPNVWGSMKLSSHIGNILAGIPGIAKRENVKIFEENRVKFESRYKEAQLQICTDLKRYLSLIEKERYAVFVTENLTEEIKIPPEVREELFKLNEDIPSDITTFNELHFTLNCDDDLFSYDSDFVFKGTFRNGAERFCVRGGNNYSVEINDRQYIRNETGLQIVLYDLEQYEVVNYTCFDKDDLITAR